MKRSTLVHEVAAEIELGLPETVRRAAGRLQRLHEVAARLAHDGLVRRLTVDPHDSSHLEVVGIGTACSSIKQCVLLSQFAQSQADSLYLSEADKHFLQAGNTEIVGQLFWNTSGVARRYHSGWQRDRCRRKSCVKHAKPVVRTGRHQIS
jgi:hypothetical protein